MSSISDNRPIMQVASVTSFRYALRLGPQQMQRLNRDELLTLCMEQYFLLWLIISIIRNPLAAIATRIIAIDLIISFAEKTVRGSLKQITERSRVYISGDGGIAKRLGIHANTVSKSFNNLEKYNMIKRDYVYDEAKQREYLDITITSLQVEQPQRLQDKSIRNTAAPKLKQTNPQGSVSPSLLTCPACGSGNIQIVCRECGSVSSPDDVPAPPEESLINAIVESTLLNKIYVVEPLTPPLDGDVGSAEGKGPEMSDVAQMPEASSTPPPEPQQEIQQEMAWEDEDQVIISWLAKRIGHGKLIYATGSPDYSKKYYNKPPDYKPDYAAYLAGDKRHILGSYLLREDGKTFVLAFDIDDPAQQANVPGYLQALAQGGAAPVYWQRLGERGHLELYFDRPVNAEQARAWCVSVCPELGTIEECYPAADKQNQPISWPLYQRKGDVVTPCKAVALLPGNTRRGSASIGNKRGLATLISQAVTPAALIEAVDVPTKESASAPAGSQEEPKALARAQTKEDLAKLVIAEFNAETTWEEVVILCGGFTRERKFKAVWRGERSPSVALDPSGLFACDYGRIGTEFPKKLDKYEVWCLAQGGREFKRFDLAKRMEAYRERQKQQQTPEASPTPPPPQQETRKETRPAPVSQLPQVPPPNQTREEVAERLKGKRFVTTPRGRGKLWRVWPSQIGVVLESDPGRVTFFKALEEMRLIVAGDDEQEFFS